MTMAPVLAAPEPYRQAGSARAKALVLPAPADFVQAAATAACQTALPSRIASAARIGLSKAAGSESEQARSTPAP